MQGAKMPQSDIDRSCRMVEHTGDKDFEVTYAFKRSDLKCTVV